MKLYLALVPGVFGAEGRRAREGEQVGDLVHVTRRGGARAPRAMGRFGVGVRDRVGLSG